LHPPQLGHDALPIEPEQVKPSDGVDHVADAGLTPFGVVEHAAHIIVVVFLDSGMPVEEGITIVDDLYFGRRGHNTGILRQGLPVLHDLRVQQGQHGIVEVSTIEALGHTWSALRTGCEAKVHEHHGAPVDPGKAL